MRAQDFLAAAEALPLVGFEGLQVNEGIVVVAPHPDDESLGCGGLIAEACARKLPVRLVVVSDGAGSHPNSKRYPRERLKDLRERETLQAAQALGLATSHVRFLGMPDRFVPRDGERADVAADAICNVVRESGACMLVVTWARDPHCDHAAASAIGRLVRQRMPALRLMEYPVWGWALPSEQDVGDAPRGIRLDISQNLNAKGAAIAAHQSQMSDLIVDDPTGFCLDATMLARSKRPFEIYLEVVE